MIRNIMRLALLIFIFILKCSVIHAQDKRSKFPGILLKKYFGVSIGYLNYFDPTTKLEPGITVGKINVPATGIRLFLGQYINKRFSVQFSDMRPVNWIVYKNINGDQWQHSLWINEAELTVKANAYFEKRISIYGESGIGFFTQSGIKINNTVVVKGDNYLTFLLGTGLQYHLADKWNIILNAISPVHAKTKQPYKVFYSGGISYDIHPPKEKKVSGKPKTSYPFPHNQIQVGYASNVIGYGVNMIAEKAHIFWGGDVEVKSGITANYQHNVYHGRKVFSLNLCTGFSYWRSRAKNDGFFILSLFPVFRFTPIHSKTADYYFNYCVAGPSFISRIYIDNTNTGKNFTFQDYLGIGAFFGKNKNINTEIRIAHYSNGGLFPQNGGIKIPLTLTFGYTF